MPWHIEKSASKCSPSKPWAVVKDSDGSVAGCHETETGAKEQLKALYANDSTDIGVFTCEAIEEAVRDMWSRYGC
jgi:hypothetical protein